ncbi:Clustered mitochondria protein 1 [Nakaseomyces bracarensis]|uniref:Clustered mitochondria protein 1 n=1 Tax=Nakaseomyces bracarensis TaxID=273131 RepID=A0ABR4NXZ2_9SACH
MSSSSDIVKVVVSLPSRSKKPSGKNKKADKDTDEIAFQFRKDSKLQNIIDFLSIAPTTKFYTNYDLKTSSGELLSNVEDSVVRELCNDADEFKLSIVLKPYTQYQSLRHVLTSRDFFGFAYETQDGLSEFAISTGSKFSKLPLKEIKERVDKKDAEDKETKKPTAMDVSEEEKKEFGNVVHELFKTFKLEKNQLLHNLLTTDTNVITPCLRSINLSPYNPVPAFYKTKGHLIYLQIVTLEGETLHITAVPSGYFINKCSATKFDPSPKESDNGHQIYYTLYDLLCSQSKNFGSHIASLEKKFEELESVTYVRPGCTTLHKPWMVPSIPINHPDYLRLQVDSFNLDPERNYNDEFQSVKDIPTPTPQSKIETERIFAKLSHEFTIAATKGAMDIFYGNGVAMNPELPLEEQIFLKNNIFYSFVSDLNNNYGETGGDDAAMVAANQDLNTLNILSRLNLPNIHHLLTTIVDFGGKRILAQTPVPGLLSPMGVEVSSDDSSKEQTVVELSSDVCVNYGLDENERKIVSNEDFEKLLEDQFTKSFHLKKHNVQDTQLAFSSQSKGILGSDKRHYILDLANTYPLDVMFAKEHFDGVKDETKRYPHRQTLLRPELVESWWSSKLEEEKIDVEKAFEENKFSYNPDAYHVKGVEDPTVLEISKYLNEKILPNIVQDYMNGNIISPYNGEHLVDTFHQNGVNLRYLGKFIELVKTELAKQEQVHDEKLKQVVVENKEYEDWEKSYLLKIENMIKERQAKINQLVQEGKDVPKELTEDLKLNDSEIKKPTNEKPVVVSYDELIPLIKTAELEIIARSLKHVLRKHSRPIPAVMVTSLVAYVFNLLFGIEYNPTPTPESIDSLYSIEDYDFKDLTQDSLVEEVRAEAFTRFRYELSTNWLDEYKNYPYVLIRAINYRYGIQLLNKNYFFTKESVEQYKEKLDKKIRSKFEPPKMTFSVNDLTIIPKVKSLDYSSPMSESLWNQGATILNESQNDGLTLLAQSIGIKEEVNSILHPSVAEKYLTLSTIYNKLGLTAEAIAFCRKSCAIYERVCGIDSFELLRALTNLATLEFANESPYNVAIIYTRILQTVSGYNLEVIHHPIFTNIFNYLEQLALGIHDTKLAIETLKTLAEFLVSLDGPESLAFGYIESRLGNLYASEKRYVDALNHIRNTERIFNRELGTNHGSTAQARQWVDGLSNVIRDVSQKKQLQDDQNAASSIKPSSTKSKTSHKKKSAQNPELADKSVDELLTFIEGSDSKTSKKGKGKSKK